MSWTFLRIAVRRCGCAQVRDYVHGIFEVSAFDVCARSKGTSAQTPFPCPDKQDLYPPHGSCCNCSCSALNANATGGQRSWFGCSCSFFCFTCLFFFVLDIVFACLFFLGFAYCFRLFVLLGLLIIFSSLSRSLHPAAEG